MAAPYSTTMNIGELKGWVLVAFLGLTLALEVVDIARGRSALPHVPEPIGALDCWEVCGWGGADVQTWTRDRCECRARAAP